MGMMNLELWFTGSRELGNQLLLNYDDDDDDDDDELLNYHSEKTENFSKRKWTKGGATNQQKLTEQI